LAGGCHSRCFSKATNNKSNSPGPKELKPKVTAQTPGVTSFLVFVTEGLPEVVFDKNDCGLPACNYSATENVQVFNLHSADVARL
jgi:hypothetical protein